MPVVFLALRLMAQPGARKPPSRYGSCPLPNATAGLGMNFCKEQGEAERRGGTGRCFETEMGSPVRSEPRPNPCPVGLGGRRPQRARPRAGRDARRRRAAYGTQAGRRGFPREPPLSQ